MTPANRPPHDPDPTRGDAFGELARRGFAEVPDPAREERLARLRARVAAPARTTTTHDAETTTTHDAETTTTHDAETTTTHDAETTTTPGATVRALPARRLPRRRSWLAVAAAVLLLVTVGALLWLQSERESPELVASLPEAAQAEASTTDAAAVQHGDVADQTAAVTEAATEAAAVEESADRIVATPPAAPRAPAVTSADAPAPAQPANVQAGREAAPGNDAAHHTAARRPAAAQDVTAQDAAVPAAASTLAASPATREEVAAAAPPPPPPSRASIEADDAGARVQARRKTIEPARERMGADEAAFSSAAVARPIDPEPAFEQYLSQRFGAARLAAMTRVAVAVAIDGRGRVTSVRAAAGSAISDERLAGLRALFVEGPAWGAPHRGRDVIYAAPVQ